MSFGLTSTLKISAMGANGLKLAYYHPESEPTLG